MTNKIMYICTDCADNMPEGCGHFDRNDLRLIPDGRWLCEACFDDTTQVDRGVPFDLEEADHIGWSDLPAPPEYAPITQPIGSGT